MSDAYDMIDRFLRNNLGDEDYAQYSEALDAIAAPAPQPIPPEFDVRTILIGVVPGPDGMGQEVYAENVEQVVNLLTEMSEKIESLTVAPAPQPKMTGKEIVEILRADLRAEVAAAKAELKASSVEGRTDTDRLAYLYGGVKTTSNTLILAEMQLLSGQPLTLDEARAAIDAAMDAPCAPEGKQP